MKNQNGGGKIRNEIYLERGKVVLYCNEIVSVVIFVENLGRQTMKNATADNVWILMRIHLSTSGLIVRSLLAKQFDVLLCGIACFLDLLCALCCSRRQLLGFVLDLLVQSIEDG